MWSEILKSYITENSLGCIDVSLLKPYLTLCSNWGQFKKGFNDTTDETPDSFGTSSIRDWFGRLSVMMRDLEGSKVVDGLSPFTMPTMPMSFAGAFSIPVQSFSGGVWCVSNFKHKLLYSCNYWFLPVLFTLENQSAFFFKCNQGFCWWCYRWPIWCKWSDWRQRCRSLVEWFGERQTVFLFFHTYTACRTDNFLSVLHEMESLPVQCMCFYILGHHTVSFNVN